MRIIHRLIFSAAALLAAPAFAQSDGQYRQQLIDALGEAAKGRCSERLMSPMLQETCEKQMPAMGDAIRGKGAILGATYRGQQQVPGGMAEVYRVKFDRGGMTWMINLQADGKIYTLWSPG
ncbi:MAG: hypothetical protein EOP38_07560 [Rubrivivax sp.]|nr:MAG: hypothetical protein EOP38_07560 [Rubrivivax sp.]